MRTQIAEKFGLEVPIFAFSHCRDVVAAVTKAGGMGILGAAWMSTEELEMSLRWIDERVDGKPYGVDLVFPGTFVDAGSPDEHVAKLPEEYIAYVDRVLDDAGVAKFPEEDRDPFFREYAQKMSMTHAKSKRQFEISLQHPTKFIVGALGVPPKEIVDEAHAKDVLVGALVGNVRHVQKQIAAGVDVLVAQGTEAGGSVGSISSMVLWPQVVEAAGGRPVLAAGGIGRGSQIPAALSLGAQGVWMGSIWLGTTESELSKEMKQQFFAAESEDAVISYSMTSKQGRMLRSRFTEAWEKPGAPKPLTWPLQSILVGYPYRRADRGRRLDYWTYSVGQIVGDMKEEMSVRRLIEKLLVEYVEALEGLKLVTGE